MKKLITKGVICLKDHLNLTYKVSDIEYIEYENGDFSYFFYPHYNVIDILNTNLFQGIPGLDLSKRLDCYERHNITPVFISERTPSQNREDLWQLLEEYNMKSLNRLKWLLKTDTQYSGDKLYAKEKNEKDDNPIIKIESMFDLVKRTDAIHKALLEIICYGNYLQCKEITINDENRKYYYDLLMPIYEKEYTLKRKIIQNIREAAKNSNSYKGRKKISIDQLLLDKTIKDYQNKNITLEVALNKLKISKATFFRRLKDYR